MRVVITFTTARADDIVPIRFSPLDPRVLRLNDGSRTFEAWQHGATLIYTYECVIFHTWLPTLQSTKHSWKRPSA